MARHDDDLAAIELAAIELLDQGWTEFKLLLRIDRRQEHILAQIDDLMAAIAADQAATDAAVALITSVQAQVTDLQAQLAALQGQQAPDLGPAIDQVNAINAELTAAEQPPAQ